MFSIPGAYNGILSNEDYIPQGTNNCYYLHSSNANEMHNMQGFSNTLPPMPLPQIPTSQIPPLQMPPPQMPPTRIPPPHMPSPQIPPAINYTRVPLNVITKVNDYKSPLSNPITTFTNHKNKETDHLKSSYSFEPVNLYTYSSKNYDMQLRESQVRFSHITEPLVRNRVHPLKETAQYKFGNMFIREPPDLRKLFPHDPDVHAPFIRKPIRENSDDMRKVAIRNDTKRNADMFLEFYKLQENQCNQKFTNIPTSVGNQAGETQQNFREGNVASIAQQHNTMNNFGRNMNDFMQSNPQYSTNYPFLNTINSADMENLNYAYQNINNSSNTISTANTMNSFNDSFANHHTFHTRKRNSEENTETSSPKKSCTTSSIGFDGIREGLFSLNESMFPYEGSDTHQNMNNSNSNNYSNNLAKGTNMEYFRETINSPKSDSSSEVEIIADNEIWDIPKSKSYGRLNINSKATNKYKNVESINENMLHNNFTQIPISDTTNFFQISENNVNQLSDNTCSSVNSSNNSISEKYYSLPSIRDFNNFRNNFVTNSLGGNKNYQNLSNIKNFKNHTATYTNSFDSIENSENISTPNLLSIRDVNKIRTNAEAARNDVSNITNSQNISVHGNLHEKRDIFKNNENIINNSTDIRSKTFLKNITTTDNFNLDSNNILQLQNSINSTNNNNSEFNSDLHCQNIVNNADNTKDESCSGFYKSVRDVNMNSLLHMSDSENEDFLNINGIRKKNSYHKKFSFSDVDLSKTLFKENDLHNYIQNNNKPGYVSDISNAASEYWNFYLTDTNEEVDYLKTSPEKNYNASGSFYQNNNHFDNIDTSLAVANSITNLSSSNTYDNMDECFSKNVKLFELMLQEG